MKRAGLLLLLARVASAQDPAAVPPPTQTESILQRLTDRNIQIRQTFDGGKDEQKPATIAYTDSSAADAHYHVDLGVKIGDFDIVEEIRTRMGHTEETNYSTSFYPTFEWHRLTTPKEVNTLSGKLNFDVAIGKLRDRALEGVPGAQGNTDLGHVFFIRGGGSRDFHTLNNALEGTLGYTPNSRKDWYPGAFTRIRGVPTLRWAPVLALDYYGNKPLIARDGSEVKDADLALARGQVTTSFWLFNARDTREFEIIVDYSYFHHLAGDERLGSMHLFVGQANWYLDRSQRVAIGYTYERGENPVRKFQRLRQSSIGLRIKL